MTKQLLSASPDRYNPDLVHVISFGREGEPVPLRGPAGPSGLLFAVRHQDRIVETVPAALQPAWRVTTTAYAYRLLDRDERELLVFHWQPGPDFAGPDYPHLHVSASRIARVTATEERPLPLDKRHIPTGRVFLAAVVRMLITEFEIKPIVADWARRLAPTEAAFRRQRTQTDW